jgi:hypothetical protein
VLKTDSEKNINPLTVANRIGRIPVIDCVEDLEFRLRFSRHFCNYTERAHKIWVNNPQRRIKKNKEEEEEEEEAQAAKFITMLLDKTSDIQSKSQILHFCATSATAIFAKGC